MIYGHIDTICRLHPCMFPDSQETAPLELAQGIRLMGEEQRALSNKLRGGGATTDKVVRGGVQV
mgnify:CR=1 FL=1